MFYSKITVSALPNTGFKRLALVIAAAIVTLIPSAKAVTNIDNTSNNPLVTEGYAQLEAGKPEVAIDSFNKALDANENDLSALLGKAMSYADKQDHAKAFSSYDTIIQHYPRHSFAWNGRGLAAFNLEDFDEALDSFENATADKPVEGIFYESLAWTQMCRGDFVNAAESAKTATLMYSRRGESSVYPILIAYFSYLEVNDLENANRTLAYAVKNRPFNKWPSPVIDYLTDNINEPALISYVLDTAQETEAHVYIGLKLASEGDVVKSKAHLEWVAKHGDPRVFEYTLARAMNLRESVATLTR